MLLAQVVRDGETLVLLTLIAHHVLFLINGSIVQNTSNIISMMTTAQSLMLFTVQS